jgi:hypothetical protein
MATEGVVVINRIISTNGVLTGVVEWTSSQKGESHRSF